MGSAVDVKCAAGTGTATTDASGAFSTQTFTINELAAVWNAVVLLAEADIFLERRTAADVQRNAMVRA